MSQIGGGCNGDIAEHLPVLRELSMDPDVRHVTEVAIPSSSHALSARGLLAVDGWTCFHRVVCLCVCVCVLSTCVFV